MTSKSRHQVLLPFYHSSLFIRRLAMDRTTAQPQGPLSLVASTIGGAVIGFLVGWPTPLLGLSAGLTGALIGGLVALVAALVFARMYQSVTVTDPPIEHALNNTTRFAAMW